MVHSALHHIYEDKRHEKIDSLEEVIGFLRSVWADQWDDSISIIKKGYLQDNYLKMAERFLSDYYRRYYPFEDGRTVGLEERVNLSLDESGEYQLMGFIDRLSYAGNGIYEIHDYKTSSRLPKSTDITQDKQLAIYSMAVRDSYPDVKDVELIWHYLAFDKEIRARKTDDQIESLRTELISLIDAIENEERFESRRSPLCDWCEFSDHCDQFRHLRKIEELNENGFLSDPGVKLVDLLHDLKEEKKRVSSELDRKIEKVEAALIELSKKEKLSVIYGTRMKASVVSSDDIVVPAWDDEDRKLLNAILRETAIWDDVSRLDVIALNKKIKDGSVSEELLESIKDLISFERKYRIYLKKRE